MEIIKSNSYSDGEIIDGGRVVETRLPTRYDGGINVNHWTLDPDGVVCNIHVLLGNHYGIRWKVRDNTSDVEELEAIKQLKG